MELAPHDNEIQGVLQKFLQRMSKAFAVGLESAKEKGEVKKDLDIRSAGKFQGIEATGRNVELPFVAFYHFDKTDKLISERVVMNLGALVASG